MAERLGVVQAYFAKSPSLNSLYHNLFIVNKLSCPDICRLFPLLADDLTLNGHNLGTIKNKLDH